MQEQLKNVQQIQASYFDFGAFAAILADGSVVTWGHADYGGDSGAVQEQLKNVQQIQATLMLLPPSWQMGLSSHGAMQPMVVTAVPFKNS